jgi:hypothetical protein
MLGIIGFVMH